MKNYITRILAIALVLGIMLTSAASAISLSKGSRGEDVRKVQVKLNELGYSVGTADGAFGAKTEAGVMAYQKDHSLPQTGIVDDATYELLFPSPTPISSYKGKGKMPKVGDVVTFGSYEQDNNTQNGAESIEWIVVEVDGTKCTLVSQYALGYYSYNRIPSWRDTFKENAFTDTESAYIDICRIISVKDIKRLLGYNDEERRCQPTAYARAQSEGEKINSDGYCTYWLAPKDYNDNKIHYARIGTDGSIIEYANGGYSAFGVGASGYTEAYIRLQLEIDLK